MRFMSLYVILHLVVGCNFFKRDQKSDEGSITPEPPESLVDQGELYCKLSRPSYEANGYIHSKCDGSGFTSLYSIRCEGVDLSGFTDDAGKLWRSKTRDCFAKGEAKAESSRDMWLMRMVAAWKHKDLDWVTKAFAFVEKNFGDICEAETPALKIGSCTMTPQLTALLFAMKSHLETGKPQTRLELTDDDEDAIGLPVMSGFEAHLDVLRIWLAGEVYGAITKAEKDLLKKYAERETRNALFVAVYALYSGGDMTKVWEILGTWPADRLPGTQDWSEPYLWQRSMAKAGSASPDWLPKDPKDGPSVQHDGTDFNFALEIASGGSAE